MADSINKRASAEMPEEPTSDRQAEIISIVQATGFATVAELAERFDVTPQTIRRDVNALCDAQALARFHGGVGLPTSTQNEAYDERQDSLAVAKAQIGELVAAQIPDRASLFLNIGTTTEAIARALLVRRGLKVVTNNLHIAKIMSSNHDFEVRVAGGLVRGSDGGLVGESVIDFLAGFRVDFGIIGISGIDRDGALLDFDVREVRASQTIISNSRTVILAADHSKFGRAAMANAGHLGSVDLLVSDQSPPAEYRKAIEAAGVNCLWP